MTPAVEEAIKAHAAAEYPKECCGVVQLFKGRLKYVPCRNIAIDPYSNFAIHPEDYSNAEDSGKITHIVHSHPNQSPEPSQADLVSCEQTGLPWIIVNWPTGQIYHHTPTGYKATLLGRVYSHGVLDCYTLVRDYYAQEVGLVLPDFARDDDWWDKGGDLYEDNFRGCGFDVVEENQARLHDILLMQVASNVINHAGIYLEGNLMMHHARDRLSSRDIWGGYWKKITVKVIRHRSLQNA